MPAGILSAMATAAFQSVIPNLLPFRFPRALENLLSRALGIEEIARVYDTLRSMGEQRPIADRLLDFLGVTFTASDVDLARIPNRGPAIVTANHPFGILEGAILASLLRRIRPDVRFLANGILNAIPEVRDLLIPVDPIHGRSAIAGNGRGLRASLQHLRSGGMLVIFPAGEVSHFRWNDRTVTDGEWNTSVARMAGIADVPVVPLYVEGANSLMFQLAGLAHSAFRTVLLCRELLNKSGRCVAVRAGAAIKPDKLKAMPTAREQTDYLRWRTYLLASREPFKPRTALPLGRKMEAHREPIAAPLPANGVADEVAGLAGECMLSRSGDLEAYLAPAIEIPKVLHELGRLRELTFRAAAKARGRHSISIGLTTTTFTCSSGMHASKKWLEPIAWRAPTLCAETSACAACTRRPSFATAIRFSIAWARLSNSGVRSCGKSINEDSRLFCCYGRASAPSLRAILNTKHCSVP